MKYTADFLPLWSLGKQDIENFISWAWKFRKKNNLDMGVLNYPRTVMFRAQDKEGPTAYVPAQPILMFESLVPKPDLSNRETAISLFRIGETAEQVMKDSGIYESYFITNDEPEVAATQKVGWTVAMHDPEKQQWLMKKKISAEVNEGTTHAHSN